MERGEAREWTRRLKTAAEEIIGAIDLRKKENENRGFWLGLPWQRQGLMTEACDAVTDFWFNTLHFPVLRAPKAIANVASRPSPKSRACAWSPPKTATTSPAAYPPKSGKSPPRTASPPHPKS